MGKTRGIGAPDDVLTIGVAVRMHCRRGGKKKENLENISKMSVESMKIARNRFYCYYFFFSPAQKTRGTRFDRRFVQTAPTKKYGIETRKEKLSPSSFIPSFNRPMNVSNFIY